MHANCEQINKNYQYTNLVLDLLINNLLDEC